MPAPKTSVPILSPRYSNLKTLANWTRGQPRGKTVVGKKLSDAPLNKLSLKKARCGGLSHLLGKWAPRHKVQRDLAQLDHKHAAIAELRGVYGEDGLLKVDQEAHDIWAALEAATDDDRTRTITTGDIASTFERLAKRQEARERDIATQQFGSTQKRWLALKNDQTAPHLLLRQITGEPSFPSKPLSGDKPQDLSNLTTEVQSCAAYFRSEADKLMTKPASAFNRPHSIEDYSTQRLLLALGSDPDTQRLTSGEASPLVPSHHGGQLVRGAAAAYRITPPVADWLNELQRQYDALADLLRNEEKLPPDQLASRCGPACRNYVALYAKTVEQLQALSLHLGIPARFADIAMGHRFIVRGYAWTLHHAAGCLLDPAGAHSGMFKFAQGVERLSYADLVDTLDPHRTEQAATQDPLTASHGLPPRPVHERRRPHERRLTAPSSLGNARQSVHLAIERSGASDEEARTLLTPLGELTSESPKAVNGVFSPDAAPLDGNPTATKDTPFEEVDRLLKAQTPNLLYGDKDFFEFDANVPSSQPDAPAVLNTDAGPRRRLLSSPPNMGRPSEKQEVKPQEGRAPSRTKRVLKRLTHLSAKG